MRWRQCVRSTRRRGPGRVAQLGALADVVLLIGNEPERRDLVRRLAIESRTDALTGMANRRTWEKAVPPAVGHAERLEHPLSVVLIDLDHIRVYNDAHAHPAGDAALREIGVRWRTLIGHIDVLGRIVARSSDCCCPAAPRRRRSKSSSAERLRSDVPLALSASAGLTVWRPRPTSQHVVVEAARALYRAKNDGRDRTCVSCEPSLRRSGV